MKGMDRLFALRQPTNGGEAHWSNLPGKFNLMQVARGPDSVYKQTWLADMRISCEMEQSRLFVEPGAGLFPRLALLRAQLAQIGRRVPVPRVHRAFLAN